MKLRSTIIQARLNSYQLQEMAINYNAENIIGDIKNSTVRRIVL
jgi:hypothetical protein